ncbi:hypothetical protein NLU13_2954 [Sarocladium strictum]|uniref:Inositol-pentakisphosphate 2-kinase n=1 Tax=Sarocladium strictum TaxID=5046 RepID=A0AA39GMX3_SARSR|nr:hypothetical protein NLU13_2954 [Sarocladium strictum]
MALTNGHHDECDDSWISPQDLERLKDISRYEPRDTAVDGQGILTLPPGTLPTRLVGEGAANAVFEFSVPQGHPSQGLFKRTVLRVAKVKRPGEHASFDYIAQHKYFLRDIRPRLGGYTVHQELVKAHHAKQLVPEMNEMLKRIDGQRRKKFRGSFVGNTDWALLLEDVRPQESDDYVLIEFKPKWLLQSPNAPPNAIRCRQCASVFRTFVTKPDLSSPLPSQTLCPLTLGRSDGGHYDFSSPFRIAPALAAQATSSAQLSYFEHALDRVANHPVIRKLRTVQAELDKHGPLRAELSPLLPQAMTLRDCTCFAQIPLSPGRKGPANVALCDFDWKNPERKLEHWRSRESQLINGGFYTAGRILCNGKYYTPPTLCLVEHEAGKGSNSGEVIHAVREASGEAGDILPKKPDSGTMYTHQTDIEILLQRLERNEQGREGSVTDPNSLKDPTR